MFIGIMRRPYDEDIVCTGDTIEEVVTNLEDSYGDTIDGEHIEFYNATPIVVAKKVEYIILE